MVLPQGLGLVSRDTGQASEVRWVDSTRWTTVASQSQRRVQGVDKGWLGYGDLDQGSA